MSTGTTSPVNSSFHPTIPGLQLAWDSTSLGTLKTCPRKYQLSIIEGWQPRATSVHLLFGQYYHSALETYDHERSKGASHTEAQRAALLRALRDTWHNGKPWFSDDQYKNRFTLIRTVVWYLEQFAEDTLETVQLANGRPAVELSFRFATTYSASDGSPFLLCGHMDRLAKLGDDFYVVDRKTTKSTITERFFEGFSPNNQFTLYSLAGKVVYNTEVSGIIVDGAQVAVGFSRFARGFSPRKQGQLDEWYKDLGFWLGQAEFFAQHQHWPMNDTACGNYGGCPFQSICSKAPSAREMWLKGAYHKRIWDPLQVRGDI
jgi:hypothetical protein